MAEPSRPEIVQPATEPSPQAGLSNVHIAGEELATQLYAGRVSGEPLTQTLPPQGAIGRFTVLKPHAQGGLGKVSLARDEILGRTVALKEIRVERQANP